jgi:hypothetical protein
MDISKLSKKEATKLAVEILFDIIEANKYRVEKEIYIKNQDFLNAADARGKEKEHLDKIPKLTEIEKILKIIR